MLTIGRGPDGDRMTGATDAAEVEVDSDFKFIGSTASHLLRRTRFALRCSFSSVILIIYHSTANLTFKIVVFCKLFK